MLPILSLRDIASESSYLFEEVLPDCVFLQFTGLKDKNDKEIYEGDIIEGPHDFGFAFFPKKGFLSMEILENRRNSNNWKYF